MSGVQVQESDLLETISVSESVVRLPEYEDMRKYGRATVLRIYKSVFGFTRPLQWKILYLVELLFRTQGVGWLDRL